MSYIETNDGVSLYYEEAGSGQPIVFLGGWCMSTPWWQGQMDSLSKTFRCIAFDPRNYGRSQKVEHGNRMSRHARDLYDVLESLAIQDGIIVGWSTGAATVLAYSELFRGEHMRGAVLVDQSPCNVTRRGWRWGFGNRREANEFLREIRSNHRAAAENLVDAMFFARPAAADRRWMIEEIVKTPASAALELERDDMNQDWRDVLPKFPVPALVAVGRHSKIFPNQACEHIAKSLPSAQIVYFEESGHCPFIEERTRFSRVVAEFAKSLA